VDEFEPVEFEREANGRCIATGVVKGESVGGTVVEEQNNDKDRRGIALQLIGGASASDCTICVLSFVLMADLGMLRLVGHVDAFVGIKQVWLLIIEVCVSLDKEVFAAAATVNWETADCDETSINDNKPLAIVLSNNAFNSSSSSSVIKDDMDVIL
jgi:hypothetical protein